MPIQELAPMTLSEVNQAISEFEEQYGATSAEFLNTGAGVPDDDAGEWNYFLLQKEALLANARVATIGTLYATMRIQPIVYGYSRFSKRSDETLNDRRPQYDCAA